MQDISECLATDPGYCTQSNSLGLELSLTSNVQLPSVECLEANSRQLKPTPMHHERTKKNRRSAGIVYNITNNHFNVMPKNSTSRGSSKQIYSLPQHQSPNQVTIITNNAVLLQANQLAVAELFFKCIHTVIRMPKVRSS